MGGDRSRSPCVLLAALLGILLPARLSLAAIGINVQVSPADLVLAAYVVAALRSSVWRLPRLPSRPVLWALTAVTVWLLVSLVRGWDAQGHLIGWALINKTFGWFVLIAYGFGGLLLARHQPDRDAFLKALLCSTAAVIAVSMVCYFLLPVGNPLISRALLRDNNRFAGLTDNPNAFAFLVACLVMVQTSLAQAGLVMSRRAHVVVLSLLAAGVLFAFSRSGWGATALGLLVLVAVRAVNYRILAAAVAFALVAGLILTQLPSRLFPGADPMWTTVYVAQQRDDAHVLGLSDGGVQDRLQASQRAVAAWLEQPVLGLGLGVFVDRQVQAGEHQPSLIHTTILWLLTETGAIGAALVAVLFVALAVALWPWRHGGQHPLAVAVFACLVVFAGISVFNEMLYQRLLWMLLALGVAVRGSASRRGDA